MGFEYVVGVSAKVAHADHLFSGNSSEPVQGVLALRVDVLVVVDGHEHRVSEEVLPVVSFLCNLCPLLAVTVFGALQEHGKFFGVHLRPKN